MDAALLAGDLPIMANLPADISGLLQPRVTEGADVAEVCWCTGTPWEPSHVLWGWWWLCMWGFGWLCMCGWGGRRGGEGGRGEGGGGRGEGGGGGRGRGKGRGCPRADVLPC
jgi:hypothetical protein